MKISRDSWHCKLLDFLDFGYANNLCAYFWLVVWAIFIVFVGMPIMVTLGAWLITMPLWWMFSDKFLMPVVIVVGTVEIGGLGFFLLTLIRDRHSDEIHAGTRDKPVHSLAYYWIKAKHDKVCPMLDFE